MSDKEYKRGGNGKTAAEVEKMQDAYVEARINGASGPRAAEVAGYHTKPDQIERLGGPVHTKIVQTLAAKGITDDFLADEYVKALQESHEKGAKERDLNATAQLLKQLGFLMGHAKQGPSVAVQINNSVGSTERLLDDIDPESIREIVDLLKQQVELKRAGQVHEEHPEPSDASPHNGVAGTPPASQETGSGGQP